MVLFTSYLHLSLAFIGLRFVLFALLGFQKREDLLWVLLVVVVGMKEEVVS